MWDRSELHHPEEVARCQHPSPHKAQVIDVLTGALVLAGLAAILLTIFR